jgi:ceramide glucosyltransferase
MALDPQPLTISPITIIKPVRGADRYTRGNFRSWVEQDYDAPIQLIFSFQDGNDPALEIAQGLQSSHSLTVIVNPVTEGYSGKMSNLAHGLNAAEHDYLVFSDSDTRADSQTCQRIVALHDRGAQLVSCLTRYCCADNLWGRIYAAFWNFEQIGFIAPSILKRGRKAIGNTIALSRATLRALGGLEAFKNYIAEDVAIGMRAYELGIRVALGPKIDSPVGRLGLRELIAKLGRAALFGITMKDSAENSQYLVLYSYILVMLLSAVMWNRSLFVLGLLLAALRVALASRLWWLTVGEKRMFYECFLEDVLFISVFVKALFSRKVVWAGIKYSVRPGGRMDRMENATH